MPLRPGRAAADAAREALNNAASTRVVISDSDDDDDGEEESDDEASSSVEEEEHTKELSAYEVMLSVLLMHFFSRHVCQFIEPEFRITFSATAPTGREHCTE